MCVCVCVCVCARARARACELQVAEVFEFLPEGEQDTSNAGVPEAFKVQYCTIAYNAVNVTVHQYISTSLFNELIFNPLCTAHLMYA